MSQKKHKIKLNKCERKYLQAIVKSGANKARKITRCRILLLADNVKGKTDKQISDSLNVCLTTVFNTRRRYCQAGIEAAINECSRSGQPSKFNGKPAAKITAIACSAPPDGRAKWSLRLLADRIVELDIVKSISHQSVSNILKKK